MPDRDVPRLVIANTDADLERQRADRDRERAEQDVSWALRQMTANLIRVVRGAGKPDDIAEHAQDFIRTLVSYRDAVGDLVIMTRFRGILSIAENLDSKRELSDVELDRSLAEEQIIRGALQITASRLVGQTTQEAAGDTEMITGVNELEKAKAEQRREWDRKARPVAKPARLPKPKKRLG